MEKIFVKAYLNDNLGDDLFINILSERYKNCNFYTISYNNVNVKFSKNVRLYSGKKNVIFNRTMKLISLCKYGFEDFISRRCDKMILIGGSMFIEETSKPLKLPENTKNYIIGTNFGPYKSKDFKEYYENIFSKCEDICFREKYSYGLFKKMKNVRVAPDIVFSLDTNFINANEEKKVIISIIDCEKKQCSKYKQKYEELILELINKFHTLNYKITLMSFCKNEGDEQAIMNITKKIKNKEILDNISKYFYSGNIQEALTVLKSSSIIVGSRFHANIIGLVFNKTILPIAYSDKTINSLTDIGYQGKIIDVRKIDEFDVNKLLDSDLTYKINVDKYKKESEKHFEKLDEVLR